MYRLCRFTVFRIHSLINPTMPTRLGQPLSLVSLLLKGSQVLELEALFTDSQNGDVVLMDGCLQGCSLLVCPKAPSALFTYSICLKQATYIALREIFSPRSGTQIQGSQGRSLLQYSMVSSDKHWKDGEVRCKSIIWEQIRLVASSQPPKIAFKPGVATPQHAMCHFLCRECDIPSLQCF